MYWVEWGNISASKKSWSSIYTKFISGPWPLAESSSAHLKCYLLRHVASETLNTYRQVFQLQLANCVVRFDVLGDQGELKVCILKHGVSLLPVRPVLGALDLKVAATQAERSGGYWGSRLEEKKKFQVCGRRLTDPFSMTRLSITTPRLLCSHTISQKFPHVFGRGPWNRKAAV